MQSDFVVLCVSRKGGRTTRRVGLGTELIGDAVYRLVGCASNPFP